MRRAFFAVAFICLTGCVERDKMTQPELSVSLNLPPGAQNIKLLNPPYGSWHTFDLTVDGSKEHYLRHYTSGDAGTESMVILPQK